jgi:PAS domain S-box-containing protein
MIIFTAFVTRYITENWQSGLQRMEQTQDELKKQQALLAASEARWRTLVIHAPVLIATVDRDGILQFVNTAEVEQFIKTPRAIYEFITPKYQDEARQALAACFASGQASQHEWETVGIMDRPTWFSVGLGPAIKNGRVAEVILIATDITRQKQAEAEIRHLNAELDERARQRTEETDAAYRELEMFSYAVSHNLRTPARGMTGFAEMLLRDHAQTLDPSARNLLRKISTNAITMGLMIDDLLDFLQLGRTPLKIRDVSPTLLAQTALESLPAYRDAHGIQITIDPMPHIRADADLLTRVYGNLLDNAIKFTRERKGAAIHLGSIPGESSLTFFVRDNGIGFDMQYVGKLFGVFQQLHRPGEYEGTGVGLATVQRIIRRHGGHVWAEAELNKGATFYFTL